MAYEHNGENERHASFLTSTGSGFTMSSAHLENGDGSPPITAFTADDSYLDKESYREEDRAEDLG